MAKGIQCRYVLKQLDMFRGSDQLPGHDWEWSDDLFWADLWNATLQQKQPHFSLHATKKNGSQKCFYSSSEVELGQKKDIDSMQITRMNLVLKFLDKIYHQEEAQNIVTDGFGRTNVPLKPWNTSI